MVRDSIIALVVVQGQSCGLAGVSICIMILSGQSVLKRCLVYSEKAAIVKDCLIFKLTDLNIVSNFVQAFDHNFLFHKFFFLFVRQLMSESIVDRHFPLFSGQETKRVA